MKKWIAPLLLCAVANTNSNPNNFNIESQNYIYPIVDNASKIIQFESMMSGYQYLSETYGVKSLNIPNGSPLNLDGFKRISDWYGMRQHPILDRQILHKGIDISGIEGTDIYSTADGIIEESTYCFGYGKIVIVNHGNGIKTLYAHLHTREVSRGQRILKGEVIGTLGSTGQSTGPHLHYEVIVNGKAIDPLFVIIGNDNRDENRLITILKNNYNVTEKELSHNQNS